MTRFVLWLTLTILFSSLAQADESLRRPNIVVVFADDWGHHAGAYAKLDGAGTLNDVVQTPNFDRVAREGVLFRNAFVSAPSCTPSRSALVSGQHFWRTGRGAVLRGEWDGSQPAFPLMLRDAGYHIGKSYKVWSPGEPKDAPFGGALHNYETAGRRFNRFSKNVTALVTEGKPLASAKEEVCSEIRGNFDAFLAARKPGQPFCYWLGPTNTHRRWPKGTGRTLWKIDPNSLQGKLPPFLPDVPEIREDVADYMGEIATVDAALGTIVHSLEEIGEYDNTLLIVSGDHGPAFPHGKCNLYDFGTQVPLAIRGGGVSAGRVIDDLVSLIDLAPTLLELGRVNIPNQMTGRSLVPILKSDQSGQVDPQRTAVLIGRERHVENARADNSPYPQRALRTSKFLYIINFHPDRWPLGDPYRLDGNDLPSVDELTNQTTVTLADEDAGPTKAWLVSMRHDPRWKGTFEGAYGKRPREELYDLRKDPHQIRNVAGESGYDKIRLALEQQLLTELRRTGDPRLIDNGRFFETLPLAGPPGISSD